MSRACATSCAVARAALCAGSGSSPRCPGGASANGMTVMSPPQVCATKGTPASAAKIDPAPYATTAS